MGDRDILIQMVLMWAEEYEKGNPGACEMILGYYKNEFRTLKRLLIKGAIK